MPRQLPAPPPLFTGRVDELKRLSAALPTPGDPDPTMAIWAIDGTGGVGKTWLALRWAHEHAQSFPDGQVYLNLRGFGASGSVLDPADAVPALLSAFGMTAQQIPAGLDAQIGLYRSVLAGKRVLMVLDNARDVEQVRPLLPGSTGCLVLVTSRNQLSGLVATHGARPLSLDLLTLAEARDLLAGRLGADRTRTEPDAVEEIIVRCARLPLALAIAAARGAAHLEFPLAALAGELRDAAGGLDAFAADDVATDVRGVFSWSYRALSADAARLFRLFGMFGLHSGPDITLPAAASLTGRPHRQVRDLLAELTRAHLLIEQSPGRYSCHDLLRAYASEQALTQDDADTRQAALHRILDHYLHTAHSSDQLLEPMRDPIDIAPPRPGVLPEHPGDLQQALDWFAAERQVLLAAVDVAVAAGFDTHAWQLAWAMWTFLLRRGHWHDQVNTQRTAVAAAGRSADPTAQARAHRNLAHAYTRLGRYGGSHTELQHALDLYRQTRDHVEQAHTHHVLSYLLEQQGDFAEALVQARQSLELHRAAGYRHGEAELLNSIGWYHALLGDHRQAVAHCEEALALLRELGDATGQASTWDSLGYAHRHLGHHAQAVTCYRNALDLFRDFDDRYGEAETLTHLGDAHLVAGQPDDARKAWEQALHILDQLSHHSASGIRDRLRSLL